MYLYVGTRRALVAKYSGRRFFYIANRPKSDGLGVEMHKCRQCNKMIGYQNILCKACKRYNLPIEPTADGLGVEMNKCSQCNTMIGHKKIMCKMCTRVYNHHNNRENLYKKELNRERLVPRTAEKQKTSMTSTQNPRNGKYICDICGKENLGGHVAKGVQKAVGNTIIGVFGALAFLTGGLTAPLMLGVGMGGAALSGSAENHSICSECRNK